MKNKYTRKVLLSLGLGLLGSLAATAQQKIGNNPGTLNPGAILELESTNRGFLLPRVALGTSLSTFTLNGTATPSSNGMMVYNTNASTPGGVGYYVWAGTTGTEAAPTGGAWSRIFTGTVAATTNSLGYDASTRVLTSSVNSVSATVTLPTASNTGTGLLTSTDWATFNAKQSALSVSNGLTLSGSNLTLGGTLTGATTINQSTFAMNFTGSGGLNLNSGNVTINGTGGYAPLVVRNANGANTDAANGNKVVSVLANSPSGDPNFILASMTGVTSNADGSRVFSFGGNYATSGTTPASSMWAGINFYRGTGTVTNGGLGIATGGTDRISVGSDGVVAINGTANSLTSQLRLPNFISTNTSIAALTGTASQLVLGVDANGNVILTRDFGSNNAGTVTSVTGTSPITVSSGTTTPVIGINQSALDLASIGGTLPVTKLVAGTAGQTLQMVGTTPTWVTPSASNTQNIYTANGTLTGNRSISMGTTAATQYTMAFDTTTLVINPTTNRIGIGTAAPVANLHVNGTTYLGLMNGALATGALRLGRSDANVRYSDIVVSNDPTNEGMQTGNYMSFLVHDGLTSPTLTGQKEVLRLNGNTQTVTIPGLAGTDDRMVIANASGVLSTQTIPVSSGGTVTSITAGTGIAVTASATSPTVGLGSMNAQSIWANATGASAVPTQIAAGPNTVLRRGATGDLAFSKLEIADISTSGGSDGQELRLVDTDATAAVNLVPTWITPSASNTQNIYTANGTLSGNRTVSLGDKTLTFSGTQATDFVSAFTVSNASTTTTRLNVADFLTPNMPGFLAVTRPNGSSNMVRVGRAASNGNSAELRFNYMASDSALNSFSVGFYGTSNRLLIQNNGNVGIGTSSPTSTLAVTGSVSYSIRKITQTGLTRALGLAAGARTIGATDRTVLINTSANPEGIEIILPNPAVAVGREYVIRKIDDSSNPVLFSYAVSGAIPAVTAGGNAILVSEGTTNQFVGSVNFVKTLRIQSDGTNWVLID